MDDVKSEKPHNNLKERDEESDRSHYHKYKRERRSRSRDRRSRSRDRRSRTRYRRSRSRDRRTKSRERSRYRRSRSRDKRPRSRERSRDRHSRSYERDRRSRTIKRNRDRRSRSRDRKGDYRSARKYYRDDDDNRKYYKPDPDSKYKDYDRNRSNNEDNSYRSRSSPDLKSSSVSSRIGLKIEQGKSFKKESHPFFEANQSELELLEELEKSSQSRFGISEEDKRYVQEMDDFNAIIECKNKLENEIVKQSHKDLVKELRTLKMEKKSIDSKPSNELTNLVKQQISSEMNNMESIAPVVQREELQNAETSALQTNSNSNAEEPAFKDNCNICPMDESSSLDGQNLNSFCNNNANPSRIFSNIDINQNDPRLKNRDSRFNNTNAIENIALTTMNTQSQTYFLPAVLPLHMNDPYVRFQPFNPTPMQMPYNSIIPDMSTVNHFPYGNNMSHQPNWQNMPGPSNSFRRHQIFHNNTPPGRRNDFINPPNQFHRSESMEQPWKLTYKEHRLARERNMAKNRETSAKSIVSSNTTPTSSENLKNASAIEAVSTTSKISHFDNAYHTHNWEPKRVEADKNNTRTSTSAETLKEDPIVNILTSILNSNVENMASLWKNLVDQKKIDRIKAILYEKEGETEGNRSIETNEINKTIASTSTTASTTADASPTKNIAPEKPIIEAKEVMKRRQKINKEIHTMFKSDALPLTERRVCTKAKSSEVKQDTSKPKKIRGRRNTTDERKTANFNEPSTYQQSTVCKRIGRRRGTICESVNRPSTNDDGMPPIKLKSSKLLGSLLTGCKVVLERIDSIPQRKRTQKRSSEQTDKESDSSDDLPLSILQTQAPKKKCDEQKQQEKNIDPEMYFSNSKFTEKCLFCTFRHASGLVSHYINKHPNMEVYIARPSPEMANRLFNECQEAQLVNRKYMALCYFCESEHILTPREWVKHTTKHTGEFESYCKECNYKIVDRIIRTGGCDHSDVAVWNKFNVETSLEAFVCKLCNYTQLKEENLMKHVRNEHKINYKINNNYKNVALLQGFRKHKTAGEKDINDADSAGEEDELSQLIRMFEER